jgi:6-pyruvoyltetrahydropterin/6-carboxytetrahydropterin synthase
MLVTRLYEFEAAHHLPDHDGKCREPHGHSYKVEVSVAIDPEVREINPERGEWGLFESGPKKGMLIDFADLDVILKPLIAEIDHHDLNYIFQEQPPTAENVALYIMARADILCQEAESGVYPKKVRLYETSKSYVEIEVEDRV